MKINNFIKSLFSWILGLLFGLIGCINIFWGNDSVYGIFIATLALFYIPPVENLLILKTKIKLPLWSKFAIAFFIIWSSVGVGELSEKINMAQHSINELKF